MNNPITDVKQSLRRVKNDLVSQYYDIRINFQENPYQVLFKTQPYKILFILGHMRAASSLLTLILNSNPEIIGYGETHLKYQREADLKKLIKKVYFKLQNSNLKMNHTYVMDKVLHNNKFIDESFLNSPLIYTIFLVREPKRTINSIVELKSDWTQEKAANYYIARLAKLEAYSKTINNKDRCLFITHEQLINSSDSVFRALQNLLDTKIGFSEKYDVLTTTGMRWFGDQSKNITAGKIVRAQNKEQNTVSEELVQKSMSAFTQCWDTLNQYCSVVD